MKCNFHLKSSIRQQTTVTTTTYITLYQVRKNYNIENDDEETQEFPGFCRVVEMEAWFYSCDMLGIAQAM